MENLERRQIQKDPEQLAMDAEAARGIAFTQAVTELREKMNVDAFLADKELVASLKKALSSDPFFSQNENECDAFGKKHGLGAEEVSVLAMRVAEDEKRSRMH
ncbi:MAG TPA: hypothetical protein VMT80_00245 [Candidatus Paceibacterota bacterium]|nr:hypothetical protein [Candidatus Paceibacterota bacterium]